MDNRIYQPQEAAGKKRPIWIRRAMFFLIVLFSFFGMTKFYLMIGKEKRDSREVSEENPSHQEEIRKIEKEEESKKDEFQTYVISSGDIPADIFMSHGKFNANDVESLLAAAKGVYDFTNLKIGQPLRFYFEDGAKANRVEYDKNTEKTIVIERSGKEFRAKEEKIDYQVEQVTAKGKIDNFFYADGLEAGLSEATVLEMGDIFSFSIDFTTEIQQGDEFAVVYEKRLRNGQSAPDGKILAAKFVNEGKSHFAYYFENNGQGGFYDEEGRVLERQFLKAPLSYRRITSGFTGARYHPITRKVSAHYQIDYAAPTGTPVVASARGGVSSAGWEGGWGNMVRLKHDGGYTTHYGHLSGIAKGIKAGASVSQGQVIGFVGSTGWSTGPHLDYGMKLNGAPVNPLALGLPKGNPLNAETMQIFEEEKKKYEHMLN